MSDSQTSTFIHIPVLSQELIAALNISAGEYYLDATLGAGGHSSLILAAGDDVKVVAIDRDRTAIAAAMASLSQYYPQRLSFWQGNFADYEPGEQKFAGIIADLGVSSPQLDLPQRGFSFRSAGPLDMRMDRGQKITAADVINQEDETTLANIFYLYGEERLSRRIARHIVQQRPFYTTTELAAAIARCVPKKYRQGRIHPATRVFQALRIEVNQELEALERFLDKSPSWLKPGGIIGIISFHSLEDRIVKHKLKDSPLLQVLSKKPLRAQTDETAKNPRSRSAKLRLARRKLE
jgi:16S rRNA (cytosine1402-N4)-methyltransferase